MQLKTILTATAAALAVAVAACTDRTHEKWDEEKSLYRSAGDVIVMQLPQEVHWDKIETYGMPGDVKFCFVNGQLEMAVMLFGLGEGVKDNQAAERWLDAVTQPQEGMTAAVVRSTVTPDFTNPNGQLKFRRDMMTVSQAPADTAYVTYTGFILNARPGSYAACVAIPTAKMSAEGADDALDALWSGLDIK